MLIIISIAVCIMSAILSVVNLVKAYRHEKERKRELLQKAIASLKADAAYFLTNPCLVMPTAETRDADDMINQMAVFSNKSKEYVLGVLSVLPISYGKALDYLKEHGRFPPYEQCKNIMLREHVAANTVKFYQHIGTTNAETH